MFFNHNFESLKGGKKKKKKKKIPNTPKKGKHIKKKIPLHILKIIKINKGSVKINKFCPNDSCSLSAFMATHDNRFHCGRCGKTKFKKISKNKS